MFKAEFDNVLAVLDRTVNSDGRVPRVSEFKNCRVAVVILADSTPDTLVSYGGGMMQQELGGDYKINPPTEELVELTSEEIAAAFGSKGE